MFRVALAAAFTALTLSPFTSAFAQSAEAAPASRPPVSILDRFVPLSPPSRAMTLLVDDAAKANLVAAAPPSATPAPSRSAAPASNLGGARPLIVVTGTSAARE